MKRRVDVGRDFDAEIKLITAKRARDREATKTRLAYIVLVVSAVMIFGAAVIGLFEDSFDKLQMVWNATGVLLGAVLMHYFGKRHG
jgi:hypothetical protein